MSEQWWVRLRKDGVVEEQIISERRPPETGWHKVDRCGDLAIETWLPRHGWVSRRTEDLHAAIDMGHRADYGPHQIVVDYAVKEIEARLLLMGIDVNGRLSREADLRKMDKTKLAMLVLENADAACVEDDRVSKKMKSVVKS